MKHRTTIEGILRKECLDINVRRECYSEQYERYLI